MKKQVKVKLNAKKQLLVVDDEGNLTAYLQSPPVNGKANAELIQLLATMFKVPKSRIIITSGLTSRIKVVELPDQDLPSDGT